MTAPNSHNHRRERHQIRRVLAEIVRVRDPRVSSVLWDSVFFDRQQRLLANDNRKGITAAITAHEHL